MKNQPAILIFDIGKTNKKSIVFDEQYNILLEDVTSFDELQDEDGFPCDDLDKITAWMMSTAERLIRDERFDIKQMNFSGYGASFVHVDENNKPVTILYNYLKPFQDTLKTTFIQQYGPLDILLVETASPFMGNLNSALQLYRIKHEQPEVYNKIKYTMHLPQYLSFIFTENPVSDITSIGCHTLLWNFNTNNYHDWVISEGIDKKLAPIQPTNSTSTIELFGKKIKIGIGIHDSSASLIPYVRSQEKPFALISTGTWCITLNPYNQHLLTKSELDSNCLCYMQYTGKQVKAAQLFAGNTHERGVEKVAAYFSIDDDFYKKIRYNKALLTTNDARKSILLEAKNKRNFRESVFLETNIDIFSNETEAYHFLVAEIIRQQQYSSGMVILNTQVDKICIDGGFGKNDLYMNMLAEAFPNHEVIAASVAQASSIGAAMVIS
ncbi:MAG: FGGY-family carbohydrate kinase [bacterium]